MLPGALPTDPTHQPANPALGLSLPWKPRQETAVLGAERPARHTKIATQDRFTAENAKAVAAADGPTKIVQGWPKLWANFRALIGVFSQTVGPSLAIRAHPVQISLPDFEWLSRLRGLLPGSHE